MNSFKSLKNFISKLTDVERKGLIRYLKYNSESEIRKSKSVKVVELLISKHELSVNEIQKIIYGQQNYYAFNKLINRLKQKVFDVVIFESSISSNNYSLRNKVLLELRKKLLQADILQLKGIRNDLLPLYNFIIKRSKLFELYDIQVQSLISKQRLQTVNNKTSLIKKTNDEIEFAESCLFALKTSTQIFLQITSKISNFSSFSLYEEDLIRSIKNLKKYYSVSKSATIGFYLYTLEAEVWQHELQYEKAMNCLEMVKQILLENESAYTENRFGTILLNLSNNNIYLYEFKKAIKLGNDSKKCFNSFPFTLKIVDEILFYAYFYNFDFSNCHSILFESKFKFENDLMKSKFEYFQSCLYFVNEKYNESISKLLNYKEIEKDKEGWNINSRILLIINRIELKEFESVDLQIQSLERFIKRISKSRNIKPRYVIILRILTKLVQSNYDYKKVRQSKVKYFNYLNSKERDYVWEIKSPELIIFHDWFNSKINGQILNHSLIKGHATL